jgi:arsenate reductase (thioredoxin)
MVRGYNVLCLCTGNRARSILAEAILRHKGRPRFTVFSAGSHPHGEVHTLALRELELAGISTTGLRSKSWNEFAAPGARTMDFVFTLCDDAAREGCPVWPGRPVTAHWGLPDPGNAGTDVEVLQRMFREAFITLDRRIGSFLSLPVESLDQLAIKKAVEKIGTE